MKFVLWVLLIAANGISSDHDHDWDYGEYGPAVWSERYPTCSGDLQSPINILTACTTYKNFSRFVFGPGYNEQHPFTLLNNGHTISGIHPNESKLAAFRLSAGDLNGTFEFVNFHVHWGENHNTGSEHEINGRQYAGELHFVYRNPLTDQTAVLGVFMQSVRLEENSSGNTSHFFDPETQHEWRQFFSKAVNLIHENDSLMMNLSLSALMGDNLEEFWRYEGSLTTPPCTEGIIWTLFKQPIMFDENELKSFRDNLYFEDYRRPQPLFTRKIYRNFLQETYSNVPDYNCCPNQNNPVRPSIITSSCVKQLIDKFVIALHCGLFLFKWKNMI